MYKTAGLLMVLATLLYTDMANAQTRPCNPVTMHACVGLNSLVTCTMVGGEWKPDPVTSTQPCSNGGFGLATRSAVCYTSATSKNEVCAEPPDECTEAGNFKIPGRCQDFQTCSGSQPWTMVIRSCPTGQNFNGDQCVKDSISECIDNKPDHGTTSTPAITTTTPSTTVAPCTPLLSRTPDPNSCSRYFFCSENGVLYPMYCPTSTFFDATTKKCTVKVDCGDRRK